MAKEAFIKFQHDYNSGRLLDIDRGQQYFFEDLMEEYFEKIVMTKRALGTQEKYSVDRKKLEKAFSGLRLAAITLKHCDDYVATRKRDKAADCTIRNEMRLLSGAFKHAKRWGWIRYDVISDYDFSKFKENKLQLNMTAQEETLLLEKAGDKLNGQLKKVFILALESGLSRQEILDLRWSQVDFENRTLQSTRQKTGVSRKIPMSNTLYSLLQELDKGEKIESGHVFIYRGKALTEGGLARACNRTFAACKFSEPYSLHGLRHTFANRLYEEDTDKSKIGDLMGHRPGSKAIDYYLVPKTEKMHYCTARLDARREREKHKIRTNATFGSTEDVAAFIYALDS